MPLQSYMPSGDLFFIIGGIGPIIYLALRMFNARSRTPPEETGESPGEFIERPAT